MSYYLFLDDLRQIKDVTWVDIPKPEVGWTIVRNYQEFIDTILMLGMPYHISFDMDLADEHYQYDESKWGQPIPYHTYKEKTGFCCAKWLVDYCINNNLDLPHYTIHSLNPVGAANIRGLLEGYQKFRDNINNK